jgi:hypothetical protein
MNPDSPKVNIDYLKRFFPEDSFSIEKINEGLKKIYIKEIGFNQDEKCECYSIQNKNNGHYCLEFCDLVDKNLFYIRDLSNCQDEVQRKNRQVDVYKGCSLIQKLIAIAKENNYSIQLADVSKFMIDNGRIYNNKKIIVSLKYLYLLTTGETWYNSVGLKEINYARNKEIMDRLIQNPISFLLDKNNYTFDFSIRSNILDELKEKGTPPILDTTSIQKYFKNIKEKLVNLKNGNEQTFTEFDQGMILYFLDNSYLPYMNFKDNDGNLVNLIEEKEDLKTEPFRQDGGKSRRKIGRKSRRKVGRKSRRKVGRKSRRKVGRKTIKI